MRAIGIAVHTERPLVWETTDRIVRWCQKNDIRCLLYTEDIKLAGFENIMASQEETWKSSDIIVTLGGDGSMLASVRAFGRYRVPILGVNLGKLGFLTEVAPNRIEEALIRLKGNQFKIEERMTLEATLADGKTKIMALNDVVVDHGEQMRLAMIDLFSSGEFVCPYDADGIVVATPTGSTAYSLSAGGPIINPAMDSMVVSPISPHTLALRAIIFPPDDVLTIRAGSPELNLRITVDGQIVNHMKSGEDITVRKGDHKIKLVKFETKSFYEVLRTKLHWGARPLFNT